VDDNRSGDLCLARRQSDRSAQLTRGGRIDRDCRLGERRRVHVRRSLPAIPLLCRELVASDAFSRQHDLKRVPDPGERGLDGNERGSVRLLSVFALDDRFELSRRGDDLLPAVLHIRDGELCRRGGEESPVGGLERALALKRQKIPRAPFDRSRVQVGGRWR